MHQRALAGLVVGAVLLLAAAHRAVPPPLRRRQPPRPRPRPPRAHPQPVGGAACSPERRGGTGRGRDQGLRLRPGRHPGEGRRDRHLHQRRFRAAHRDARRRLVHHRRRSARTPSDGLTFTAAGTYPFHCKIHSPDEGHDHGQLIGQVRPAAADAAACGGPRSAYGRSATKSDAPEAGRSSSRPGSRPRRTRPRTARASRGRCPGTARRAGPRRPARPGACGTRRGSTAAASRARPAGRRVRRRPGRPQRADRIGQLVQGVLEVGEVELAGVPTSVDLARGGSRSGPASPAASTFARARATESGSNSTPTSFSAGNRRAIAISQRPPPQWMSTTRPPPRQVGDELRQLGQRLLEEDRDVLDGQPLDRRAIAIRPLRDRPARYGRSRACPPSRARRSRRGRTGRRGTPGGPRRAGRRRSPRRARRGRPAVRPAPGRRPPTPRPRSAPGGSRWPRRARRPSGRPRRPRAAALNSPSSTPR